LKAIATIHDEHRSLAAMRLNPASIPFAGFGSQRSIRSRSTETEFAGCIADDLAPYVGDHRD